MAVRNHALDGQIVEAARTEFLEYGFQKASVHRIAARAGITTGALYTRYKSKDDLFRSLIDAALARIESHLAPMRERYLSAGFSRNPEAIVSVIKQEEQLYLELLFDCYEECILFFCRSDGSSVQTMIEEMTHSKAEQTVLYLRSIARPGVCLDGVEILMAQQFLGYRMILEQYDSRERAADAIRTVELVQEAGWKALLEHIL